MNQPDRAQQEQEMTTLDELVELGLHREPKSKQKGLKALVEHHLSLVFDYDFDNAPRKMSQSREREIEAEIRGFCKAQEKLREVIAIYGTDAILGLSDVREDGQRRPRNLAGGRNWS